MASLVNDSVLSVRDESIWGERVAEQEEHKTMLAKISENYADMAAYIADLEENR